MGHIIWTIIIGFVAGVIAKLIYPGNKYEPTGYIWTTVLGIIGAFVSNVPWPGGRGIKLTKALASLAQSLAR